MRKSLSLTVLLCIVTMMLSTGCKNKPKDEDVRIDTATVVLDMDSIVLRPFLPWDAMLADLKDHLETNYAGWTNENPDSLTYDVGTGKWKCTLAKGNLKNAYYFDDAQGNYLKYVSFGYYGSMPLDPLVRELERNGFIRKGEIVFPGYDAQVCYLYLSESGKLEIQLAGWEDGAWVLTFQPTDPSDFKYLVNKTD